MKVYLVYTHTNDWECGGKLYKIAKTRDKAEKIKKKLLLNIEIIKDQYSSVYNSDYTNDWKIVNEFDSEIPENMDEIMNRIYNYQNQYPEAKITDITIEEREVI